MKKYFCSLYSDYFEQKNIKVQVILGILMTREPIDFMNKILKIVKKKIMSLWILYYF